MQRGGSREGASADRRWNSEVEEIYTGLTENEDRVNLNPLDLADAYARLIKLGASVDEIAERAKRNRRTIRKYLYLSGLPDDIRKIIDAQPDVFTTGALFNEVASRKFGSDDELRNHIQGLIKDREHNSNSPAKSEGEVEDSQDTSCKVKGQPRRSRPVDPELIEEIVSRISGRLPVKVRVKGTHDKGKITINYVSREQLDQLLSRFQE